MGSDEQLMQAVQGGDLSAFEQIILRHQAAAWNTAYHVLNDAVEAEDVAQEAFLRVLDAAPRYQPTAKFQTYLLRIVARLCLDRLRKKRPAYTDNLPEQPTESESPDLLLAREEDRQIVRQTLDLLPPQQRLALILRYDEDLSYLEIAAVLQVSTKAVERLLARGRAGLAAALVRAPEADFVCEGDYRRMPV